MIRALSSSVFARRLIPNYALVRQSSVMGSTQRSSSRRSSSRTDRVLLPPSDKKRLVILGTGWGSYSVLNNVDKSKFHVTVISPRNHFLFTPLLASCSVGTLEHRSIIEPVRSTGFRDESDFHLGHVSNIDPSTNSVTVHAQHEQLHSYKVKYDYLVVGVGSKINTFGIPGVAENAFFLKEIGDAQRLRTQILDNFEAACHASSLQQRKRLLHFVVVGGGPTGVEFSAELYDFLVQDVVRYYPKEAKDVRVTLVEGRTILAQFVSTLRDYAVTKMKHRKQISLVKANVTEVTSTSVSLDNNTTIDCGLVVWSAGNAPRNFVKASPFPKSKTGALLVNDHLQLKLKGNAEDEEAVYAKNIFALGDCADMEAHTAPKTAQCAESQGEYLSAVLSKMRSPDFNIAAYKPYRFKSKGMLAYVGGFQAVADVPGLKLKGFHSWVLWRSVYMTKLGSWRLRLQVPFDWFKTFFFGRDISRL